MIRIQYEVEAIRHLAIERHTRLHSGHLTHSSHILALCQHDRVRVFAQCLECYVELGLVQFRHLTLEYFLHGRFLLLAQGYLIRVFLADQVIDRIAIHTNEAALLELLLQLSDQVYIQLSVHFQDAVTFVLCGLYIAVLLVFIGGIQID